MNVLWQVPSSFRILAALITLACEMILVGCVVSDRTIRYDTKYRATIKKDNDEIPTQLYITLDQNGHPVDFSGRDRLLHAHLVDISGQNFYHEHPVQTTPGDFVLDLPKLKEGAYDLWLEVTMSSGHHGASFIERSSLGHMGNSKAAPDPEGQRITISPENIQIQVPGKRSHLYFLVLYDGKPVEQFGLFVGVRVHTWVVSEDGLFFLHDHAKITDRGMIDVSFTLPSAGRYVVFVQPAVQTKARLLTPIFNYPIEVDRFAVGAPQIALKQITPSNSFTFFPEP